MICTLKGKRLFTLLVFLGLISAAGSPVAQTNLAEQDYQDYLSSRYSSANWNAFVQEGMEAFHNEKYDIAQKSLYKAFNAGCESPVVLFMLALISEYQESFYSAIEYYQMAEKGFKKANRDHRFNQTFAENYGRALYHSGKKDEALPLLKHASKKTQSYWLLKLLGMLAYEQGDSQNALSYFERAIRVKTPDVTQTELVYIYTLLGRLFLQTGEQEGAMRSYMKVLELDPANAEAQQFKKALDRQYQQKKMMDVLDELKDT